MHSGLEEGSWFRKVSAPIGQFRPFAASLPDRDFWGKKGRFLRGDFKRFQEFFDNIEPFQSKCFLVAEEESRFVGFAVGIHNPEWVNDLTERYGRGIEKRAHILGIAFTENRKGILKALTKELTKYFSGMGIRSVEYPTFGNVCLTTGTDVLTSENVDALIVFREAGFRISECYYSMTLDLDGYKNRKESALGVGRFRFGERAVEIADDKEIFGKIAWDPIENGKTSIDIYVARGCRGKGLGTVLVTKALERLRTAHVRAVELGVDGNNLFALKLYRKFGFEVQTTHFYIIVSL